MLYELSYVWKWMYTIHICNVVLGRKKVYVFLEKFVIVESFVKKKWTKMKTTFKVSSTLSSFDFNIGE
jgi:hypothetical protein